MNEGGESSEAVGQFSQWALPVPAEEWNTLTLSGGWKNTWLNICSSKEGGSKLTKNTNIVCQLRIFFEDDMRLKILSSTITKLLIVQWFLDSQGDLL